MAVEIDPAGGPVGRARPLFEDIYRMWNGVNFDVTPDGTQFVMVRSTSPSSATHLNLRLNWFEEVNALAPLDSASQR